jgi:heptaprenyl diphosphate synthase
MTSHSKGSDPVAFLGALCLFLSTVEYLIPKPMPFLRVGIANLPLLLGLRVLAPRKLFLVAVLKVLGQALIGGTLVSYIFLFSSLGTAAGLGAMLAARAIGRDRIGLIGISVAGALASNLTQIALARLLILGTGAWLVAPLFLAAGTVTSILLGVFADAFSRRSKWYVFLERSLKR